ncbi:hypothetical protein GCK72_020051 [Caenorhabditis remanei]|uniref:Uncharacterized protein n=1 Tax=Caenorhabditis remanei TaxID=31234 RepID=A0A6A5GFG8_CAERE|nr:hypothetical protein GCK72_020051 [Caenorhabditis remanei]KAF1753494.1 hypothetical protein GCK72_020051 [Caenorhabditis remanei]
MEVILSLGRPETEGVHDIVLVSWDWVDWKHVLWTSLLPWISETKPVIWLLNLPSVTNELLEDSVFVTESVSVSWNTKSGHRVEETSGKTSESSVSESSVLFDLLKLLDIESELVESLIDSSLDTEVHHSVGEGTSHVELQREVVNSLWILVIIVLLGTNPTGYQVITNSVGKSKVVVTIGGDVTILDDREVKMSVERLLDVRHILHLSDTANGNLLTTVVIVGDHAERFWCFRCGRSGVAAEGLLKINRKIIW